MLESEMIELGTGYFKLQKEYHLVKQEIPFLSRCIDVVLLDQSDNLISIEFKINKWRHAITQAKNHKLGSDKAYICLPERKISDELTGAVSEAGIGLFFFNSTAEQKIYEVIPAPNHKDNIPAFRDMLMSNISRVDANWIRNARNMPHGSLSNSAAFTHRRHHQ